MGRLEGKCAIILGAASRGNMGQAIARHFSKEGAKVVVAGRHREELERLAGEIGGWSAYCDIAESADIEKLARFGEDVMGGVSIAVNCTGWGLLKPFLDTDGEDLSKMANVQFIGPFQFFQAMIKAMQNGGSIIQISSAVSRIMFENHAAYMGTKAAIDHVVRCVANEFGSRNIRANTISPGLTETEMVAEFKALPGAFDAFERRYPLGRIGTCDDIACAAVWLASDECFMTGENLQVNGGLPLRGNPTQQEIEASIANAAAKND